MSVVVRIALSTTLALCTSAFVTAQGHPTHPAGAKPAAAAKAEKPDAKAPEMFVIVKVGEHRQVMAKNDAETLKKQKAEQFEKAKTAYETEKKAAEAAGKKFDKPAPHAEMVETSGGEFPSKAAADSALAKMVADEKKAEEAKKKAAEGTKKKEAAHPATHHGRR